MYNFINHIWNKLNQNSDKSSVNFNEFKEAANIVDISYVEFCKINTLIKKNQHNLSDDFNITIESHPGSIGTTTLVKISKWINTPILFEENVTDYSNW